MHEIHSEPEERERIARREALQWGWISGILTVITFQFLYVLIDPSLRIIASLAVGTWVGFFARHRIYITRMAQNRCPSCGAPGAMVLVDRAETLVSSTPRQKIEVARNAPRNAKHNTRLRLPLSRAEAIQSMMERSYQQVDWLDEVFDVVETHKCNACGHVTEDRFEVKRQADRRTRPIEN